MPFQPPTGGAFGQKQSTVVSREAAEIRDAALAALPAALSADQQKELARPPVLSIHGTGKRTLHMTWTVKNGPQAAALAKALAEGKAKLIAKANAAVKLAALQEVEVAASGKTVRLELSFDLKK